MNKKKIAIIVSLILIASVAIYGYINIFSNNTKFDKNELYVFVPTGSTYDDVLKIVGPNIKNINKFKFVAEKRSYNQNVFPGRFLFKKGMSSFQMITALRHNEPLKLAFNNQESLEKLVSRLSSQIEVDSTTLINSLRDTVFMKKNGFNNETILGMFIPNTYEVKWNISAEKFREKMAKEYTNFWNKDRLVKAKALGVSSHRLSRWHQ